MALEAKLRRLIADPGATDGEREAARIRLEALKDRSPGDLSAEDILAIDDSQFGPTEWDTTKDLIYDRHGRLVRQ